MDGPSRHHGHGRNALELIGSKISDERFLGVAQWLRIFIQPGQVVELRGLYVSKQQYRRRRVDAGFFDYDHFFEMPRQALLLSDHAKGVYSTRNPLDLDLLARCNNPIDVAEDGPKQVVRRKWLLIDPDPKRDALISATEPEKARRRSRGQAAGGDGNLPSESNSRNSS